MGDPLEVPTSYAYIPRGLLAELTRIACLRDSSGKTGKRSLRFEQRFAYVLARCNLILGVNFLGVSNEVSFLRMKT